MTEPIHYCSRCVTTCCDPLIGLKVTRDEYDAVFRGHDDALSVKDLGAFVEITAKDTGTCPNFIDRRCAVYDRRPVECRLYPYSIETVMERANGVRAYVHGGTQSCPFKAELLPHQHEVRTLMERFLAMAYPGRRAEVVIQRELNYTAMRLRKLRVRVRRSTERAVRRFWPLRDRRSA